MIDLQWILLAFMGSLILTPLVKKYSVLAKAYAKENERTVHHGLISRIGGVAIYLLLSWLLPCLLRWIQRSMV